MKVTEKLARYILSLQRVADAEIEEGDTDIQVRNQLESEFPILKQERENTEFETWFWTIRVEKEPEVMEARFLIGTNIPFDSTYYKDNPNAKESTYHLYREHTEVAFELFQEAKNRAESKLIKADKNGSINLHKEWMLYKALDKLKGSHIDFELEE